MEQITSDNHYVPRAYLARWSTDGETVWEHKLVVPHESYPIWRRAPLREAGARRHFYDAQIPGLLRDHFESWFQRDVETPAYASLRRVESDEALSRSELNALVRFAVAQDMRTVKDHDRYAALINHQFPLVAERAVRAGIRAYNPRLPRKSLPPLGSPIDESPIFRAKVLSGPDGDAIEISLLAGASLWLQRTKRMVQEITSKAVRFDWKIVAPPIGRTWPTSDHPLVRFERRQDVAIHGTGWLRKRTEIFLPLTPNHALYTAVGVNSNVTNKVSLGDARMFVRLIVGHAHRSVFAQNRGFKWVEWEDRRRVDVYEFNQHGRSC